MIYADYAATTPVHKEVLEEMLPYFTQNFYNPSSIYPKGREVHKKIEQVRETIARYIGAEREEIIFVSGGTEGDNLAIKGVALEQNNKKKHIVTTKIEHHGVLEPCAWLETQGFEVTYLEVDDKGSVSLEDLRSAMTKETCLVSIMWVNNEIGTIQNIKQLAEIAHEYGAVFHTDGVQAMTTQGVDIKDLGVDLFTFSAHKFYGPKGIGVLYKKRGTLLSPLNHGGQQENFVRGGTENVPAIVGMGKAVELLLQNRENHNMQMETLKNMLVEKFEEMPDVIINSPVERAAPTVLNIGFKGLEAEGLVFHLSREEIMVSMGAACNTNSVEPSYVLKAIGVEAAYLRGCIRISFGGEMTKKEAQMIFDATVRCVKKMGG